MNRHTYAQYVTGTHPGYGAQPAPVDDLAAVESIAIASHKRSALVTMRGGMQIRFKVTDAKYLVGLVALAKAQGRPEAASYTGVLIYRVVNLKAS